MNYPGTNPIKTKNLELRRFEYEDALELYSNYGSDDRVNRYINFNMCTTLEKAEEFIDYHLIKYQSDPGFFGWAVTLDGKVIGSAALFNFDNVNDSIEVGYSIGSRWWNRGYMTEVLAALISYAFENVGANRVFGIYHIDNAASGRVMHKNSMKKEGVFRKGQKNHDGTYSDAVICSILREEYYGNIS